jgi:hypothetical protein
MVKQRMPPARDGATGWRGFRLANGTDVCPRISSRPHNLARQFHCPVAAAFMAAILPLPDASAVVRTNHPVKQRMPPARGGATGWRDFRLADGTDVWPPLRNHPCASAGAALAILLSANQPAQGGIDGLLVGGIFGPFSGARIDKGVVRVAPGLSDVGLS